ncbi:class I SAM-dependent methyltransferase [Methylobacterium durans]|uniref:Methyltransferase type 11 n=1 Tax=Methylobacterium durans TaxID=2202825 RepID=A0A2U8W5L6_9HYPH|nr:class I SAM-dependent methyltransferase [Methylobacterium durans]AWN40931.1 methyltransferase type 11 [Methylobacterium durans]MEA1831070.1 class I SAM-dependent methyltransferase [Methylobacterium durans]
MPSPRYFINHFMPFTGYPYTGAPTACNLCGSREAVTVAETDRRLKTLRSIACTECGLIRTDPMPTPAELAEYYANAYRADYQLAFAGGPPRHHLNRSAREAAFRADLLAPMLRPGARVLDFGSGSGEFLAAVRARGCEAIGVEPGRDYAAYARQTHGVEVLDDAGDERFEPGYFDVITTHHVMEHLRDPADVMERLARWLKPDGVLYAAVPNMAATAKPPHERFHFAHVHGFVRETFDLTARRAGLVPHTDYWREDTTVVYRKTDEPVGRLAAPGLARRLAEELKPMPPGAYLASGAWIWPMVRRNAKAVRDTFASR